MLDKFHLCFYSAILMNRLIVSATYKTARKVAVFVVGMTVIIVGIAMIVLPGPATVVIPIGLGILGLEFAWARRWLKKIKDSAKLTFDSMSDHISRKKPAA